MKALDYNQVEDLVSSANGSVSYQSHYARTTTEIQDGRIIRHQYASDYLRSLIDAEREAARVVPTKPVVSGVRAEPYTGPFPRGKHSHRCVGCAVYGQYRPVACYKSKCTRPQLTGTCPSCAAYYR